MLLSVSGKKKQPNVRDLSSSLDGLRHYVRGKRKRKGCYQTGSMGITFPTNRNSTSKLTNQRTTYCSLGISTTDVLHSRSQGHNQEKKKNTQKTHHLHHRHLRQLPFFKVCWSTAEQQSCFPASTYTARWTQTLRLKK